MLDVKLLMKYNKFPLCIINILLLCLVYFRLVLRLS